MSCDAPANTYKIAALLSFFLSFNVCVYMPRGFHFLFYLLALDGTEETLLDSMSLNITEIQSL